MTDTDNTSISKINERKKALKDILDRRNFDVLISWAHKSRNALRTLTSFQFDTDPLVCMRAVEAMGKVAAIYADSNPESIRKAISRFFWMMNDESGNVGWYSPEAIGEILRNVPVLIAEYAPLLPSYLIEEPFEKGTRIAIARIAEIDRSPFDVPTCKKLVQSLTDPNPYIRATSIIALKALRPMNAENKVRSLISDGAGVTLYNFNAGIFAKTTIGKLAKDY